MSRAPQEGHENGDRPATLDAGAPGEPATPERSARELSPDEHAPDEHAPMHGFRTALDVATAAVAAFGVVYAVVDLFVSPGEASGATALFSDRPGPAVTFVVLTILAVVPALRVERQLRHFPDLTDVERAATARRLYSLGFLGITMAAALALYGVVVPFVFRCGLGGGSCTGTVGILYRPLAIALGALVLVKSTVEMEAATRVRGGRRRSA